MATEFTGPSASSTNGYANGAAVDSEPRAPSSLESWRGTLLTVGLRALREQDAYKNRACPAEELLEPLTADIRVGVDVIAAYGIVAPRELTPQDILDECERVARMCIEEWCNYPIVKEHPAQLPAEIVTDPMELAIAEALSSLTDIKSGIEFERADAYLERTRVERGKSIVLVEGLMRSRNLSMLCGRAWSGKTTMATYLARCLVLGETFFGSSVRPSKVGYMALERNGEEVAALFEQWQIADQIAFKDQVPIGPPRDMAMALGYAIRRHELEVIFIDHLVGMIQMEDGNDYTGVSKALAPFNAVAKLTGAHIFLLHHQPKAAGSGQEINVMGSEAFRAATDMLCETTKIGCNYFYRAQSRGQADLERIRINRLSDGMLTGEAGAEGLKSEILQVLEAADCGKTASGILELSPELKGIPNKTFLMALNRLAKNNELYRTGKGRRGSPYYYSLSADEETEFRRAEGKK